MYKLWPGQAQYMTIFTFIWPLGSWPLTLPKNVSNGNFSPQGQQLCKIILKSIHKCTSSGSDKLNTCIWPFRLYLTPVTLTFNLPEKSFKWHFSSSAATTVPNCFEIRALLYKLWSGQIRMDARTHAHTPNKNCNNYVSLTRKRARQKNK